MPDPRPLRRRLRLPHHDYAQPGAYFVTICSAERACLFGEIIDGTMRLNALGFIVEDAWRDLPQHYEHLRLDEFVVMPNHLHGVLAMDEGVAFPVPEFVRAFKTFSARRINTRRNTPGAPVWQRSYHDHVVRDEAELARIREYIRNNPIKWELDDENPARRM
ncbi:MAG: transposase [Pseudomonadota bacterium]